MLWTKDERKKNRPNSRRRQSNIWNSPTFTPCANRIYSGAKGLWKSPIWRKIAKPGHTDRHHYFHILWNAPLDQLSVELPNKLLYILPFNTPWVLFQLSGVISARQLQRTSECPVPIHLAPVHVYLPSKIVRLWDCTVVPISETPRCETSLFERPSYNRHKEHKI